MMPIDETRYFFSYARNDTDFVLKLAKELRAAGANLWLDQLDIVGGQRWDRAVEKALATCRSMIVVLSPESVASNNVMDEVSYALEENKLVVPVLYKACDVPFRLRRVQRIDFTTNYDAGFAHLLRALGIEQPTASPDFTGRTVQGRRAVPSHALVVSGEETPEEVQETYPDFIPLDSPYPEFDPTTPPKERYARYHVIRSVEGRPDLKIGKQYRVKKGIGEALIAKGYLEHVKRGEIEAPSPKQPPVTTKPPQPEEQVAHKAKEHPVKLRQRSPLLKSLLAILVLIMILVLVLVFLFLF